MPTYSEKLRDPRWSIRRREIIERDKSQCRECSRTEELEVHHVIYIRGREPWDYPNELLLCLCRECHFNRQIHDELAQIEFALICAQLNSWQVYALAKKLAALNGDRNLDSLVQAIESSMESRR